MRILRPVPPVVSRVATVVILVAWAAQMGLLVRQVRALSGPGALAGDLSRYGSSAQWRGIYMRGEKIGFSVTQTLPLDDGYEIQEDGRLQMALLGVTSRTKMTSRVRVGPDFGLRSFSYSLDPGTGPVEVSGQLDGRRLSLDFRNRAGVRQEVRELEEAPAVALNLPRQLVAGGLEVGKRFELRLLDPLTLRNAPVEVEVAGREVVRAAGLPVPTYRLKTRFLSLEATMWMTDTGEVVREESPLGMLVVKESPERARTLGLTTAVSRDLLDEVSVVPKARRNIPDPTLIRSMRLRVDGADALLADPDVDGGIQTVNGHEIAMRRAADLEAGPLDPERLRYLAPEPLIESDDPAIQAETAKVVKGIQKPAERAERLLRHVNLLIDKRPTVSLPSAAEVLRTRVGDCNEHTVLYVAMARAAGLPARIAVGLVYLYGAFHYHAWAEVYLEGPRGRGVWWPVDPTFNQFPADPSHLRLARGGLDKQASIVSVIGRIQITITHLELLPAAQRRVVGSERRDVGPIDIPLPRRGGGHLTCWGDGD